VEVKIDLDNLDEIIRIVEVSAKSSIFSDDSGQVAIKIAALQLYTIKILRDYCE